MSLFTKPAAPIFAGHDDAGNAREISTLEVQVWGTEVETIINAVTTAGGVLFASKATMDATLTYGANTPALVIGDATPANNGLYRKSGVSGSGSWIRVADVPGYSFVRATNAGAGSANAIVATTAIPVNESQLIALPITVTNTATPVTVAFNGGSTLTIKTNSGNNPAIGGLTANAVLAGYISGSTFRLLSDQASGGFIAAMEALVLEAEAAKDAAEAAASSLNAQIQQYETFALAKAATVPADVDFLRTLSYVLTIRDSGVTYIRAASDPGYGEPMAFQSADGSWWKFHETVASTAQFGADGVTGANDNVALTAFFAWVAAGNKGELAGSLRLGSAISVTQTGVFNLVFRPDAKLTYTGATEIGSLVYIDQAGHDVRIASESAGYVIDGNDLANIGLHLRNTSTTPCDQIVHSVRVENCRAGVNDRQISGIFVAGAANFVEIIGCAARDITRAGGLTNCACQGIVVTYLTTPNRNPKRIVLRDNSVENVSSGTPTDVDNDGIVLFQLDGNDTSVIVTGSSLRNCKGRGLKIFAEDPVVENTTIYRDVISGSTGANEIQLQKGTGFVRNTVARYAGSTVHNSGTRVVSFSTSTANAKGWGNRVVDGLTISDQSTGGATVTLAVEAEVQNALATTAANWTTSVSNVTCVGKNIRSLIGVNNNGTSSNTARVVVENINVTLDYALMECDGPLPNLKSTLRSIRSGGSNKPVVRRTDGAVLNDAYGQHRGDASVTGIWRSDGRTSPVSGAEGFAPPDAEFHTAGNSLWSGLYHALARTMNTAETVALYSRLPCILEIKAPGAYGTATIEVAADGTVTRQLGNATYFAVGTGSKPAGAHFNIWTASGAINVSNDTGSPRLVSVIIRT